MHRSVTWTALTFICSFSLICPLIEATNPIWLGVTADPTVATNWSPNVVPNNTLTGILDGTSTNDPQMTPTSSSLTFSPYAIQYTNIPHAYNFLIRGLNSTTPPKVIFGSATLANGGVDNFTIGSGRESQIYTIQNGTMAVFTNTSSADFGSTGTITYNLSANMTSHPSSIYFQDQSKAGAATIVGNNIASISTPFVDFQNQSDAQTATISMNKNCLILFEDSSTANSATITMHAQSPLVFEDSSTAANAKLTLDKSDLTFSDTSNAGNSTIKSNGPNTLTFNTSTPSSASLTMTDSTMQLAQDFTLANLKADATSIINLNSDTLTINTTVSGHVIAGVINGAGGTLVKGGAEDTTLSLTGANTYDGGTIVNGGILIVTGNSLPIPASGPAATVNGTGTLDFNQTAPFTYTGSFDLTAPTAILKTDVSGGVTLQGAINGTGQLVVNSGITTLTNTTSTYSGGTTVNANAILNGDSTTIKGNVVDNGIVNFNQISNGTFTGAFSASSGVINKQGNGTLTFATPSPNFQGTTNVVQGALLLDTILGGSVNVSLGALLGGSGKILGNLHNSGTVSPGNGIGTLNVGGNYIQDANAIYSVELDPSGNSDLLDVGGTAQLNGILNIQYINGVPNTSTTYTILHANGGVVGTFPTVISSDARINAAVIYLPNDVQIILQPLLTSFANTHNERVVSQQLNAIMNPTAAEQAIISELSSLGNNPATLDDARRALAQMSGEQYTNNALSMEISTRQFIRRLFDPLRVLMNSTSCCAPEYCDCYPYYHALDQCMSGFIDPWMEIDAGRSFIGRDSRARGLKMDTFGVSIGAHATYNAEFTLGIAGRYEYSNINYNIGGTATNNNGLAGLYWLFRPCGYYFLGDFIVELGNYRVKRPVTIGSLDYHSESSPKVTQKTLYLEAGKDLLLQGVFIQPFVGIEVAQYSGKKFSEHGADPINLCFSNHSHTNVFSRLGFHVSTSAECWSLNIDLGWQYRITCPRSSLKGRFMDFGDTFTILGVAIPRNSLDATINVSRVICGCWELYADLSGEGWSRCSTYSVVGGVRCSW